MSSQLLEILNGVKTMSIVGMCKNAGKTTMLNWMLHHDRLRGTLGLTSIGRDGESTDVVTGTEKPGIFVREGTLIATARDMLRLGDVTTEILETTGIPTPLGEVVILRARSAGNVQLAGPSITSQLREVSRMFFDLGADKSIIDGVPAQLRQLPGAERRLVPHRRAHRAGKRTAAADHAGGTKMSKAKCIMVQGTMSGAGKSLLCAALCRIFAQDGWRVAPFKSQNMALNSFVTRDGLEMGRAQVVQAQAAGVEPDVRMNPILLKPSSDIGSQVIVNGEVRGQMPAAEYFRRKKQLIPDILAAYNSLVEDFDIIVIEGAGSPAEINLKADDIVNMGLAKLVDAPVLLVGDIDRGGVFAQLFGTVELLEPDERARIKGLIINKFRGDVGILRPGLAMLEEKTHLPVFGVVPYLKVDIEDEDSLSDRLQVKNAVKPLDAAIVRLPHISNFTDFMPLEQHPLLGVRYVQTTRGLGAPDCVILPGTKNTVDDLLWLRQCGLEAAISKLAQRGTPVLGVCGGYQMLGQTLADPEGTESGRPQTLRGLGLLPTQTTFTAEKRRTQSQATVTAEPFAGAHLTGYEIHTGRTTVQGAPFCTLADGTPEGCVQGQVFGTYLHGLFDSGELTEQFAAYLCRRKGIDPAAAAPISMQEYRTQQLDLLADGVRHNLDLAAVYAAMGLAQPAERGNDQ